VRSFGARWKNVHKTCGPDGERETLALIIAASLSWNRHPPKFWTAFRKRLLTSRNGTADFIYEGEPAEQAAKVERSGLQGFFEFIEIVTEKTPKLMAAWFTNTKS